MKKFKILAVTAAAAVLAISCFALVGCGGGNSTPAASNTTSTNTAATNTAATEPAALTGVYEAVYVEDSNGDEMEPAGDKVTFTSGTKGSMSYEGDEFAFTYKVDGESISWTDISSDTFEGKIDGNQIIGVYNMKINGDSVQYGYVFEKA